jgi:hypothetical protein
MTLQTIHAFHHGTDVRLDIEVLDPGGLDVAQGGSQHPVLLPATGAHGYVGLDAPSLFQ